MSPGPNLPVSSAILLQLICLKHSTLPAKIIATLKSGNKN